MFSRWWSHTATSSDGLGGNYGDLVYNQITWDPEGRAIALTTPNQWGNTPWPSMQHEGANRAAQAQLTAATRHFADRYAVLAAQPGGMAAPAALVMEWGSGYWDLGDMSRRVRDAAQADGVKLSVVDGLDAGEIAWMQRSIATYNHGLAQAYAARTATRPSDLHPLPAWDYLSVLRQPASGLGGRRRSADVALLGDVRFHR
jgi:hypothetical protein